MTSFPLLNFTTPFELLVATILSAQCSDKLVNTVTPALFNKFPTAQDFANTSAKDIDLRIIKVTFHSSEARNIQVAAKMIVKTYGGKIPETMQELDAFPGVARKTANVVPGHAFGKNSTGISGYCLNTVNTIKCWLYE